jgi:hypothetical protein
MIELATSNPTKALPTGNCLTCYWWSRNKQAKKGSCNKSVGQLVRNPELQSQRIAYPVTVSSETCQHYRGR